MMDLNKMWGKIFQTEDKTGTPLRKLIIEQQQSDFQKERDLLLFGMYITGHDGLCIPIENISKKEWEEIYDGIERLKNIKKAHVDNFSKNK